ncbi:MAG: 50S ribosomal protein L1 [Planctomycetales bacterium 12-60-4]|nr:MAG: 50S ribosomal protein L1 [Planctomycetales bacterium 12-60-4]
MPQYSKRLVHLQKQVATVGTQDLPSAVKLLQSLEPSLPATIKKCRFDQTVTLAVRLGVDPKQADQRVRGSVVLPHGIGKAKRVLVFCQGDNLAVAQAAGADFAGGKELADKIKDGWTDFDVAIATPDMMGVVGPLGRVLGPRGLMPSPRAGTVTQDVATAVKEYKAGKVEFRCDDGGNVHCVVGKLSFEEAKLVENVEAFLKFLRGLKPSTSKGQYIRNVCLTATMSPGIAVAV